MRRQQWRRRRRVRRRRRRLNASGARLQRAKRQRDRGLGVGRSRNESRLRFYCRLAAHGRRQLVSCAESCVCSSARAPSIPGFWSEAVRDVGEGSALIEEVPFQRVKIQFCRLCRSAAKGARGTYRFLRQRRLFFCTTSSFLLSFIFLARGIGS
ncbi:uncharacterized protein J3D65DRAFT_637346 [Phyllosticta citribraziliensis]|uniref:Uncharacterized protein n=1 Tax=Phyllosticta citribraziliensis TaxID=989973 RepID=A0ABR1L9M4_9PEZI